MKILIFSIRDSKSEVFSQPFFSPTRGSAIRAFADAVNDPATDYAKHPDDYTLFYVGDFDVDKGEIIGLAAGAVNLGLASTFKGGN